MAKILTWADMPTGITKGSPTNRCPTRSMIESNVQSGYTTNFLVTIASNQLVSSVSVNQNTRTFTLILMPLDTSTSYSGYRQIVNILGDVNERATLSTEPTDSYDDSVTYTWDSSVSGITVSLGALSGFSSSNKSWTILTGVDNSISVASGATITSTVGTTYGLTLTGTSIQIMINVSSSGSGTLPEL